MNTSQPNKTNISRRWHLIDAKGQIIGRLATQIVKILMGKDKRTYAPHVDGGDFVVVINSEEAVMTGDNKINEKIDFRHSGYPGGETMTPYREFLKKNPERAIVLAVKGMLPKNKLRPHQINRLKVYKGSVHPHSSQFVAKSKEQAAQPAAAS
jgi:large subunit ribosomal protein L13